MKEDKDIQRLEQQICIYENSKTIEEYCITRDLTLKLSFWQKWLDPICILHQHRWIAKTVENQYANSFVVALAYFLGALFSYLQQYSIYGAIDVIDAGPMFIIAFSSVMISGTILVYFYKILLTIYFMPIFKENIK